MKSGLKTYVKDHCVLLMAVLAAAITACIVPPDADYLTYIDLQTIGSLFCVIAVANAFRRLGAFDRVARLAIQNSHSAAAVCVALVAVTAVLSMFITNDMALLVMLPLTGTILLKANWIKALPATFILEGLAANLCGMLFPFGNPQNLYLFSYYHLGLREFLEAMAPTFGASVVILALLCAVCFGRLTLSEAAMDSSPRLSLPVLPQAIYSCLAIITLLGVFRIIQIWIAVLVVLVVLLVVDRLALRNVDYYLLGTFVAFFIFAGNVARISQVTCLLEGAMEVNGLLISALISQVISNVPAAVLLSQFTAHWQQLLIGVNIGGAGTLVGSLASLITLQYFRDTRKAFPNIMHSEEYSTARFIGLFCAINFTALAWLLVFCAFAY